MFLLDTDILSNLVRKKPPTALVEKIATVPKGQQFTSTITLGELVFDAQKRREWRIEVLLCEIEILLLSFRILPFDTDAARHYGEVRAELECQGTLLADADLRIGAIALAHDLVVVTGNIRHFQRNSGLSVQNWLEG